MSSLPGEPAGTGRYGKRASGAQVPRKHSGCGKRNALGGRWGNRWRGKNFWWKWDDATYEGRVDLISRVL